MSATLGGLSPDTIYHYRVTATNSTGTRYGGDRLFQTLSAPQTTQPRGGGPDAAILSPPLVAPQPSDVTPPRASLTMARKLRLDALLHRGLTFGVSCSEACRVRGELVAGKRTVARRRFELRAPSAGLGIARPARRWRHLLRRQRVRRLSLRVTVTDAAGNRTVLTRSLKLRR